MDELHPPKSEALRALYWRSEILQVMYWLRGEGFGDLVDPPSIERFLGVDSANGITYLEGKTDYALHPVFQTKWMKYGLKSLGLPDPYTIPKQYDSY